MINNGYQKLYNLLENTSNQPPKFRIKKLDWNKWWIKKKLQ